MGFCYSQREDPPWEILVKKKSICHMTFNIYKFLEFDSDIILSKLELPTRGPLLRNSSQEKFDMSYVIDINDIKIIFLNKE